MLIEKIGGNWHKVLKWNDFIIGYKSGGIVIVNPNLSNSKEFYIPFYSFSDFIIEEDILFIRDKQDQMFQIDLDQLNHLLKKNTINKIQITMSEITNEKLIKSFYGGVQMLHGAVFSKRAPLAAEGKI